jgi:hypothetical protein
MGFCIEMTQAASMSGFVLLSVALTGDAHLHRSRNHLSSKIDGTSTQDMPFTTTSAETEEIRKLIADNNLERATKRTFDFVRIASLDRRFLEEAVLISSEVNSLDSEKRRLGTTSDLITRERDTKSRLLQLLTALDNAVSDVPTVIPDTRGQSVAPLQPTSVPV